MAMVHQFEYKRPGTLQEALGLLAGSADATLLAGGTDLVPNMKEGFDTPGTVIDIKGIEELRGIEFDGERLTFGALTTFSQLIESEIVQAHYPVIAEVAGRVASIAIRNRATVAGNVCSAVPCMDSGPLLSAYDAELNAEGPGGKRTIPVHEFFTGPRKTCLRPTPICEVEQPGGENVVVRPGEIVTSITLPLPAKEHAGCYIKQGRYKGEDLAQASVLVLVLPGKEYRIAFGSVAPVPVRGEKIEALLKGKELSDALIASAKALVPETITPITDIRASKEYRMHMSQVMLDRALKGATQRLTGNGPAYGALFI
ncbi:MAG: xanthine dehydrogenase family protein subunit M [bacterium]|nr:xanthine dehydrogenase family protein subunit M [bacterium]